MGDARASKNDEICVWTHSGRGAVKHRVKVLVASRSLGQTLARPCSPAVDLNTVQTLLAVAGGWEGGRQRLLAGGGAEGAKPSLQTEEPGLPGENRLSHCGALC